MWWAVWKKRSRLSSATAMNATALQSPTVTFGTLQPNELDRRRIERSLENRKRYRYVSPTVRVIQDGYLIESPCCSRNIDPEGGIIDVALLLYVPGVCPWRLYRKEHSTRQWELYSRYQRLVELLDELNTDTLRLFWQ